MTAGVRLLLLLVAPFVLPCQASAQNPRLLKDIGPGSSRIGPVVLWERGGVAYFAADDGVHGTELWKTDGTTAGTVLVKDILPGARSSFPGFVGMLGNAIFVAADDGVNGSELWRSDGTAAGTVLVKDIDAGAGSSGPSSIGPWRSGVVFGDELYFSAFDSKNGVELWKTDGTAAGTVIVADIVAGPASSFPTSAVVLGNRILFSVFLADNTQRLYRTDGTSRGTVLVTKRIEALAEHTVFGNEVYFVGRPAGAVVDIELWKSDGTDQGTVLVKDIFPGTGSSYPNGLLVAGGKLYFSAQDPVNGTELWASDASGTVLVRDIVPGPGGSNPRAIAALGGALLFSAYTPSSGEELWASRGTAASTQLVADINPGPNSSHPGRARYLDLDAPSASGIGTRRVWFAATDSRGTELWESDGSKAGTRLVGDLAPGSASSHPLALTLTGGRVVFSADTAQAGRELWVADPGATAQPAGRGCGGAGRRPTLLAADPVLGTTMPLSGSDAPALTFGLVLLGTRAPKSLPLPGSCRFFLDLPQFWVLGSLVPIRSDWKYGIAIPNDRSLGGLRVAIQVLFMPTNGPLGFDLTNVVALTLGN